MGKVFNALKKAGEKETIVHRPDRGQPAERPAAERETAPSPRPVVPPQQKPEPLSVERGDWDERLTLATAVSGSVAESFRTLRTRLLHPESGAPVKKVLVTSATPGEGKSFVCANLGLSFAQGMDHQGLLVNCDLRKPSLERLFGLANERGLVNYLRDNEELSGLITKIGVEKLRLLPSGPPPVNPAELLGSEAMERLMQELGSRYDDRMVFFDSPPLQAASETTILAKYVDAVVLVIRWGAGRREHIKSMIELVGREKIVAVVFNAYRSTVMDNRVFGSYEYQQYGYYYGDK